MIGEGRDEPKKNAYIFDEEASQLTWRVFDYFLGKVVCAKL